MDDHVTHLESKMREFTTNFNNLVDAHSEQEEDIEWVKAELAD